MTTAFFNSSVLRLECLLVGIRINKFTEIFEFLHPKIDLIGSTN